MAKKLYEEADVRALADKIREKSGSEAKYRLSEMAAALDGIKGGALAHADMPAYTKRAVFELARRVRAACADDSIVFVSAADAHQVETNENIVNGNRHAAMAMKALAYILPEIDFCCFLGDSSAGSAETTLAAGRGQLAEIKAWLDEAFDGIPQFRTVGNHDGLKYSLALNGGQWLRAGELFRYIGSCNSGAVQDSENGGWCCRDFPAKSLRVICLNTAEDGASEGTMSARQLLWLAQTLADVGAKSGWRVIILSHHPLDSGAGTLAAGNMLKAYIDGGTAVVSGTSVSFAGANGARLLAAFHGHTHNFRAEKMNSIENSVGTPFGLWNIATPNMCFYRSNEYGENEVAEFLNIEFGESVTYAKTAGSAEDTAFTVNVVNPSEERIYSFCCGAGCDRDIFIGKLPVAVTGISLSAAAAELSVGGQISLTAEVTPSDASDKTVVWSSSAPETASVSGGVVSGLSEGGAVITAACGGFTASCTVTVTAQSENLIAAGCSEGKRLSTGSGELKDLAGYFTTDWFRIDSGKYPDGFVIRVSGLEHAAGNVTVDGQYIYNAWCSYVGEGKSFNQSAYISGGAHNLADSVNSLAVDADDTGFSWTFTSAPSMTDLGEPRYLRLACLGSPANASALISAL